VSLRLKLLLSVLLVGLVPLGISGWTMLSLHQRAFEARTAELHRKAAEYGASALEGHFERTRTSLSQAVRAIDWQALTEEERTGALWLIYSQVKELAVVTLLDVQGRGVGPSAYLAPEAADDPEYAGRPRASIQLLTAFSNQIPFDAARAGQLASGAAFDSPGMSAPLVPLAVPVRGPAGEPWVVAAAVSLAPLCDALSRVSARDATAYVVDARQRLLCHPLGMAQLPAPEPGLLAALEAARATGFERLVHFQSADGEDRIAAVAPTPGGAFVVVEQSAAVAFGANTRMRTQTLTWLALALVVALGAGLILARQILRPVKKLLEGALQLAQGKFDHRLPVESRDELGQLSRAFNDMGTEVQARDREIRALNEDLQRRVEERTRELREAQDQLLHSQKMAAVTGLGAGFAHELNNPLTAVIGLTQILVKRLSMRPGSEEEAKALTSIQEEAHRIRKVVRTLLSLTQSYGGDGFSDIEVHQLIDDSLTLVQDKLTTAQIHVVRQYDERLPPVRGNSAQLREVLLNLINNSRAAMNGSGGTLRITTSAVAGQAVRIEVQDTGRGIPPEHLPKIFDPFFTTKDEWRSEGLGLTVVSRVVEQHKGRIQVESEVGRGTALTITLPAAPRGAHLA
jgi:signal transduction histidine kinase